MTDTALKTADLVTLDTSFADVAQDVIIREGTREQIVAPYHLLSQMVLKMIL